jgi:hypothetical protein
VESKVSKMSWEDILKRSNSDVMGTQKRLRALLEELRSGELDLAIKVASNESNFKYDPGLGEPLKLTKQELIDALATLFVGLDAELEYNYEAELEDAGDRAFVAQFES